jgi:tRNA A-37 threonylcarbamoyl transferase component Bud32
MERRQRSDVDVGRPFLTVAVPRLARRRRPSGRTPPPPPLLTRTVRVWLALVGASALLLIISVVADVPGIPRFDAAAARMVATLEATWGHALASAAEMLDGTTTYLVMWIPTTLLLLWSGRWRHLGVYVTTLSVVSATAQTLFGDEALSRAIRTTLTGSAESYVLPSWNVIVFSTVATATVYALVPAGPLRRVAFVPVAVLVSLLSLGRIYQGLDEVSGDVMSAVFGCGVAVLAFSLLAPAGYFPVTYLRTNKAHLRLDAGRRQRVIDAVKEQLGVELSEIKPFRLAGSAGSTPCRLKVSGDPNSFLFGKLYATNHLRSDRWYKFARLLRYGALEDEGPFASVRRLVEHEDYMLRLFRDHAVNVPRPYGVSEVIPGREYLLVTEFIPDAVEVLEAAADEEVLDDALRQVRRMWDAGVAHRDVKPSNVLVRDRQVYLVDVGFGELRPSLWREAVDLANMMLTLALVAGADKVYARAVRIFDPHEIAEAFAASGSVTIPRQLHRLIGASGSDLLAEFRALAPQHPPIAIQRWSIRRVAVAAVTVLAALTASVLLAVNLRAGQLL